MKISFLIPAMVLYIVRVSFCYDIRVGTVLFTKQDLVRKCWTESDKALLRARIIMQDVLPDPVCIDFSKPRAVTIILDYIYACFHIVRTSTYGKVQNLMYLALADTVGGYLRAYILPLAKKSYYAGIMNYDDACRVFALYDEVRRFLKTNGKGWTEPQKLILAKMKIMPLQIIGGDPDACKMLFTIEKKGKIHIINAKKTPKKSKTKTTAAPQSQTSSESESLVVNPFPLEETTTVEIDLKAFSQIFNVPESTTVPAITPPRSTMSTMSTATMSTITTTLTTNSGTMSKTSTSATSTTPVTVPTGSTATTATTQKMFSSTIKRREVGTNPSKCGDDVATNSTEKREGQKNGNETGEAKPKRRKTRCDCCAECAKDKKTCTKAKGPRRVIVPLPIIDDDCEPHTIAVPFRNQPLRSLWKKTSAYVLEHYYVAVLQCFISKGNTRADIKNFNSQFHTWLSTKVYPHLEDEQWYPGFGGVLRVRETIKRFGMEARINDPMTHDIAFMFEEGVGFNYDETQEKTDSKDKPREIANVDYFYPTKTRFYYAMAILAAAFIWFITFCICAYLCLKEKNQSPESGKPTKFRTCDHPAPKIPSQESQTPLHDKKGVSFQFLVRFFKKQDGGSSRQLGDFSDGSDRKKLLEDSNAMERKESQRRLLSKIKEDEQTPLSKSESARYLICEDRKPTPSWCCVTEKFEVPKKVRKNTGKGHTCEGLVPIGGGTSEAVKTLWKNPFLWPTNMNNASGFDKKKGWFKFETKKKNDQGTTPSGSTTGSTLDSKNTSNKRSTSTTYSEGCPNSCSSMTNCSSHSHVKEKCSSATMEFFENVISRHKPTKKCLKQKSPSETESEDDSYTSENEY